MERKERNYIIAFYSNQLCHRGTTVALYDYAHYNETILLNKSIILYNYNSPYNDKDVLNKFINRFGEKKVFGIKELPTSTIIDNILEENSCDVLYVIKYGYNDGIISNSIKTCIHCVFTCAEPHGDVYSRISNQVKGKKDVPVVPHMISLPSHNRNMRQKLGIPEDAIVFGRYGGYYEFNIQYVKDNIIQVALTHPNIYFLFANTETFGYPLENIIFLDKIIDLDEKVEFIQTCDAMIWGRLEGETFGLSIGEFSSKNKPILCCTSVNDNAHINILREKAIIYNEDSLYYTLIFFKKTDIKNWNAYEEYCPEKVMEKFKSVYLTNE